MTEEFVHVYALQCDGCRRVGPVAFHRIVAIGLAKRKGYTRHEVGAKPDILWLCTTCGKKECIAQEVAGQSGQKPAVTKPGGSVAVSARGGCG